MNHCANSLPVVCAIRLPLPKRNRPNRKRLKGEHYGDGFGERLLDALKDQSTYDNFHGILLESCLSFFRPKTAVQPIEITSLPLRELEKDRETDEREKREKIYRDQEEERQRIALKEAEATAEFLRKQEKEMEENARRLEEQRLADLKALEEQKEAEEFANRWESVMNVARFKELWASLPTNGSFQCYLKTMPTVNGLTDHMKKQGFHVVFAVNPNAANIEVGICNIRPVGQEPWFMARFLVSNNSFSAVMKSNSPEIVPGFVKKFALAKVLKIDNAAKP
jgi:hypothetical protein